MNFKGHANTRRYQVFCERSADRPSDVSPIEMAVEEEEELQDFDQENEQAFADEYAEGDAPPAVASASA